MRQGRILLDKDGSLAALKTAAETFNFLPLQPAVNAYTSYALMGNAEESCKILNALATRQTGMLVYASLGLVLGPSKAFATQRGLLITSDNTYFRQVEQAMEADPDWVQSYRTATALYEQSSPFTRGIAGLRLYVKTASIFSDMIQPELRDVIKTTLDWMTHSEWVR